MRFLPLLLAAAVPCFAAGCNHSIQEAPASMQDNLSKDVFALLAGNPNGLSSPYVQGSKFSISIFSGSNQDSNNWTLTSSNAAVMAVARPDTTTSDWSVVAGGVGTATLSVVDASGKTLDSADIQVEAPTAVQLCAQGLLMSGESDAASSVSTIRVVSGGTATFLARYYNGTQELSGNNALHPTGTGGVSAAAVAANFSVRDFLAVSVTQAGTGSVDLGVGSLTAQVPVIVVDGSTIAKVGYAAEIESGANKGQDMYVFGRAFDAQGNDVFGASFAWSVDGSPITASQSASGGPTDLVTYQYDPSKSETIGDSLNGLSASTQVHGGPATTSESTTENVSCSVARGVGADRGVAWGAMFVVGIGVIVARRKRSV